MLNLKNWINEEPENIDFIVTLEHFGYKGKVFEIVYRKRMCGGFSPLVSVEAFDKYSENLIALRYIPNIHLLIVLEFEINRLKEALKNTMITSEDIYK